MLDVANTYQDKASIKKILDWMALLKMNTLHLHLNGDSAWRLEINGLPELTASPGFYNRSSFIEILQYAAERKIEIIPEIDLLTHAGSARRSMDARYRKFQSIGKMKEALEFFLGDTLTLRSDGISLNNDAVCVCSESFYRFFNKVVLEIRNIYRDAGLSLKTLHLGGQIADSESWRAMPSCREFLASHPEYQDENGLKTYFLERASDILLFSGVSPAAWESTLISNPTPASGTA